jgi:hypothetical protein
MSENSDEFEAALRRVQPGPPRFDRDHLMFTAGQAVMAARCRRWQRCTGLLGGVTLCLAVALALHPVSPPEIRVVRVLVPERPVATAPAPRVSEPPPEPRAAPALSGVSYLRLQQALAHEGVEEMPGASGADVPAGGHIASVWEWHSMYGQHPAILAEGE